MIDSLRTSPGDNEPSYLMSQYGPCTTDPFAATTWRAAPMSTHQMGGSREALMRAPPLEFKDSFTFCAYANRLIFPGLGILMGASDEEEASLGNWQKGQTMSARNSAHNERLPFGIQSELIKACKQAATKTWAHSVFRDCLEFCLGRHSSLRTEFAGLQR